MISNVLSYMGLSIILFFMSLSVYADDTCQDLIPQDYIQHEQRFHVTMLAEDLLFQVTFYKEYAYRIVVLSDQSDELAWELLDEDKQVLFSNALFDYSPYWDFNFMDTMECTIKVKHSEEVNLSNIFFCMGYKSAH